MKKYTMAVLGLATLAGSGCGGQSDKDFIEQFQARQVQVCIDKLEQKKVPSFHHENVVAVCTCTFDRLLAHTPVKAVRDAGSSGNPAAAEGLLLPFAKECAQNEVDKIRAAAGKSG